MLSLASSACVYSQCKSVVESIFQSHHFLLGFSQWTRSLKKALEQAENSSEHVLSCVLYARADLVLYVSW